MVANALMNLGNDMAFTLVSNNNIVYVSEGFLELCGYTRDELVGKSLKEVISILRITSSSLNSDCQVLKFFLFTKSYDLKQVKISTIQIPEQDNFMFIFNEIPNSRLDVKFPVVDKMFNDNKSGVAIFSAPDLILLKANKSYIDILDEPYNKIESVIGKRISDIVTGWDKYGNHSGLKKAIETCETQHNDEFRFDGFKRGTTYWKSIIVPIIEDGHVAYLVVNLSDETEKVKNRKLVEEQAKIIKEQNKELDAIIKSMSDGLVVIDKDMKMRFLNKAARNYFYEPDSVNEVGKSHRTTKYYDISTGEELPEEKCLAKRVMNGEDIKNIRIAAKRPDKTIYTK